MAYEVFTRTGVRVEQPSLSLVPDGRIALNAAAVRVLAHEGIKSVLLLWDSGTKKMALKAAAKNDRNAFAVSVVRDTYSGSIRAKQFLDYIGWTAQRRTMLPATWNGRDRMLEITVPKDQLRSTGDSGSARGLKMA